MHKSTGSHTKKLIGIAGKKGSGKDVATEIAHRIYGELYRKQPAACCTNIRCADVLKEMCVGYLGIHRDLVYGDNDAKNKDTDYKWDNQPMWLRWKYHPDRDEHLQQVKKLHGKDFDPNQAISDETYFWTWVHNQGQYSDKILRGSMSVRHVLQVFGTDYLRRFHVNFHADALVLQVQKLYGEGIELVTVSDVRFPNEVWAIVDAGGYVIRLTREPYEDTHESENALNDFPFETVERCVVLDNSKLNLRKQDEKLSRIFTDILRDR